MTQLFQCDVCKKTFNTMKEAADCEREHADETCKEIERLVRHLSSICKAHPILNIFVKKKDSVDRHCVSYKVETVEVKRLDDNLSMTPYIKIFAEENKEEDR